MEHCDPGSRTTGARNASESLRAVLDEEIANDRAQGSPADAITCSTTPTTVTPPEPPRRLSPDALDYWHRRAGGLTPRIIQALETVREHALADGYANATPPTYEDNFAYGGWLQKRTIRYRVSHRDAGSGDVRRYTITVEVGPNSPTYSFSHTDDEAERTRERTLPPGLHPDEREFHHGDWPHPGGGVDNELPSLSLPPPWGERDPHDDWPPE